MRVPQRVFKLVEVAGGLHQYGWVFCQLGWSFAKVTGGNVAGLRHALYTLAG
jgi:hypothetical protein